MMDRFNTLYQLGIKERSIYNFLVSKIFEHKDVLITIKVYSKLIKFNNI